jgi:hypothetical protein
LAHKFAIGFYRVGQGYNSRMIGTKLGAQARRFALHPAGPSLAHDLQLVQLVGTMGVGPGEGLVDLHRHFVGS